MGTPSRLARSFGRLAAATRLGARTLLGLDTNPVPAGWRHVTKVDPEDEKRLPLLYPRYLAHTSAVSVGGSRDVTAENTEQTFELLGHADVPAFHEPSAAHHVTERTRELAAFLAIPEVLNGHSTALIGTLGEGTEYLRRELVPGLLAAKLGWLPGGLRDRLADFATTWLLERAVFEAYVIQNPDSAAAREAAVTEADRLTAREAAQRAMAAERHLESEVIYVEYSGTFGGDEAAELLAAVSAAVSWPRVWYGGGLDSRERASRVLEAGADAVVVGNVFHDIAAEEAALLAAADDELDADADAAAIRDWVGEAVAIEDAAATRYLATTPDVADPTKLATDRAVETVRTWLALGRLADRATTEVEDANELRRYVEGLSPGELPGVGRPDVGLPAALARDYARGYLADALEVGLETPGLGHVAAFGAE